MAEWELVSCLVTLRDEFDQLAPNRDRASDGSIGDTAHASNSSDHNPDETGNTPSEDSDRRNEVHAIDVDDDLRKPGTTMQGCLNIIIARHRDGLDDRLQNIIYNRRIWSRSWGWASRAYTGSNAHTEHAHFSARYTSEQEADTSPWGLLEGDDMPTVAELLAAKVPVGGEDWRLDTAIGYAARKGYEAVRDLAAFTTAEAARDAQTAAVLAGMRAALTALTAATGALTPAQVEALTEQVRQAAAAAGAAATAEVVAKVDALRDHLGDDAPTP
jgi:hypothetical protein